MKISKGPTMATVSDCANSSGLSIVKYATLISKYMIVTENNDTKAAIGRSLKVKIAIIGCRINASDIHKRNPELNQPSWIFHFLGYGIYTVPKITKSLFYTVVIVKCHFIIIFYEPTIQHMLKILVNMLKLCFLASLCL